jgi:hypothetical protein
MKKRETQLPTMKTLNRSHRFFVSTILLLGLTTIGQAARDKQLNWEKVWPKTQYLQGEVYSAEGKAWVHNSLGVMVSEDGLRWTAAKNDEPVPPNPVLEKNFTIHHNGFDPVATTVDSANEPTTGYTVSGVAVWFEDEWWINVPSAGPTLWVFHSSDGLSWSRETVPAPQGPPGAPNSTRITVAEGRLLFLDSYYEIVDESFGLEFQIEPFAVVYEYQEGNWSQIGNKIQLPKHLEAASGVFSLGGRVYVTRGNRSHAVDPKPNDPHALDFGKISSTAGFLDAETPLLRSAWDYFLAPLNDKALPRLITPPSESTSYEMLAMEGHIYAVGVDGTVWKREAAESSPWLQLTAGLDTGEGSRNLSYSQGLFRYTSETASLISSDGIQWSAFPDSLPTPNARFRTDSAGFLAESESAEQQQRDYWYYNHLGWTLLANSPMNVEIGFNYVPEIGLVESYQDDDHLFFATKPGGRIVPWRTPATRLQFPPEENRRPLTTAHRTLAYGEGLVVGSRVSKAATSSLQFTEPTDGNDRGPVFDHSRFWIVEYSPYRFGDDDALYRSEIIEQYPFDGARIFNNSWELSDWFGWVNTEKYPWAFHVAAGWVYVLGPDEDNCWIWDAAEGWFWTNQYYWPTIWSKDQGWRGHGKMMSDE